MKIKYILLIMILMVFLSTSAVFADDLNDTDIVGKEESVEIDQISSEINDLRADDVDEKLGSTENSSKLSVNEQKEDLLNVNEEKINVSVSNANSLNTITAKDLTQYYKSNTKYKALFRDGDGDILGYVDVKISVNGVTYNEKTDANGVASLNINFKPGTYKIVAENPVTGYTLTTTYKILSTITAKDISKVYGDNRKFTAKFLKSNGKALAKKTIKFKVNGKTYKVKTDKNGIAELSLKKLKKGTYKIISYNVDGVTKTNKVKVVKSTTTSLTTYYYTFLKSDKKVIKAKLLNKFGYAPNKGKVIKFKINGKKYSAKTNSKGIAKIKLPSLKVGVYKVSYSFAGNSYYKKSSASNKVAIISTKNPTFTIKSPTVFGYGAGTSFKVALTAGKVPLEKRVITLKVAGNTYTKTTNSKGIVSLPIKLSVGQYVISYSNKADSKVKSKTSSSIIKVKPRIQTSLTWESGNEFSQAKQSFKILLKDSNDKVLSDREVKLTINSKTYSAKTASNGYATFITNLYEGNYKASFSVSGDNYYESSSGSNIITVVNKNNPGFGYYVHGSDMKKVDLTTIASQGVGDIFLNYYAISLHGKSTVENWISQANKLGIRVHIWEQVFKTENGWTNPIKDGSINSKYLNQKISEAMDYAKLKGVSGIHLDYLRYNGAASSAINQFVKQVTGAVHGIDSNLIVSCTLMPEPNNLNSYYGQDYSVISQYMDVVIPMIYKGNYGKDTSWITNTAKWFIDNSKGAKVWVGLQGYNSDTNLKKLSTSEMKNDVQKSINAGADGAVIFRWSLTNLVNFNSLNIINSQNDRAADGSSQINPGSSGNSDASNSTNPSSQVNGSGNQNIPGSDVNPGSGQVNGSGSDVNPGSGQVNGSGSDVNPDSNVNSTGSNVNNTNSSMVNGTIGGNSTNSSGLINGSGDSNATNSSAHNSTTQSLENISISDIITAAHDLQGVIYDAGIPKTVSLAGKNYSTPQFLYLMTKALGFIENKHISTSIQLLNVSNSSNPIVTLDSGEIYKLEYLDMANRIANFIEKNSTAPNFAASSIGDIGYNGLVDIFTRILSFYKTNNRLPEYVEFNVENNTYTSSVSIKNIVAAAYELKGFFESQNKFTSTVNVGGMKVKLPEFLYLMSQAISQISVPNTKPIIYISGIKEPESPYGGDDLDTRISKTDYVKVANNVVNFIKNKNKAPKIATLTKIGDIHYLELIDAFSRILAFYYNNNRLPDNVNIHYPYG